MEHLDICKLIEDFGSEAKCREYKIGRAHV